MSSYSELRGGIAEVDALSVEASNPADHGVRDLSFKTDENVRLVQSTSGVSVTSTELLQRHINTSAN